MSNIYAEINKLEEVLVLDLEIPFYQRPYRWGLQNIMSLLNDIYESWQKNKSIYRIGSLILYKDDKGKSDKYEVVDGQQRVTSILLLLYLLKKESVGKNLLENLKYEHQESKCNIVNNHKYMKEWIEENIQGEYDRKNFYSYVIKKCEFVKIVVYDLSEAFQMFDSQNSRGKELKAYNLLKAYHIQAMENEKIEHKIEVDKKWEDATRYLIDVKTNKTQDILNQIFKEQVYRTRVWSRKDAAFNFTKKKIDEFKGQHIDENLLFPYQNIVLLQDLVRQYVATNPIKHILKNRFNSKIANVNSFVQLNQNIINGYYFFQYIATYVEIYKQLFIENNNDLKVFQDFYKKYSKNYTGSKRSGDTYLREVYKSSLFSLFDKFGIEILKKYYKTLYVLIYQYRLTKKQVKYKFLARKQQIIEIFTIIAHAKNDFELLKLKNLLPKDNIKILYSVKEIEDAFNSFDLPITLIKKEVVETNND